MGTVRFFEKSRELPIEASSIVGGSSDSDGDLILITKDGTQQNLGNIKGDTGPAGVYNPADIGTRGIVALATDAEGLAATDGTKVLTPKSLHAAMAYPAVGRVRFVTPPTGALTTNAILAFDTVDFDTDGLWDATNHRFNVTKAGYYRIRVQTNQTSALAYAVTIEGAAAYGTKRLGVSNFANNVTQQGTSCECLSYLNVGDFISAFNAGVAWTMRSEAHSNYLEFEFVHP